MDYLTEKDSFEVRFNAFKTYIDMANHVLFFGGAGVSVGSGIPDFRSKNGLYNNMPKKYQNVQPEYMLSRECLTKNPDMFFSFYRNVMDVRKFEPNSVHKYLAQLENEGKMEAIVTQNVDMLHEKAGSKKLYKIHGTSARNRCDKCGRFYDADYVFTDNRCVPMCNCGGIVRPDIVLYGEPLPEAEVHGAITALRNTDLLIVCGTSLTVQPAASFVSECHASKMVIINQQSTPYDQWADIVFREDMNLIFNKLLNNK